MEINEYQASSGRMIREDSQVVNIAHAFDASDEMFKVKSMQKKWRESWPGAAVDNTQWDVVIGSGGSVAVSGGNLTVNAGVNANAEVSLLSKEVFSVPFKLSFGLGLSQRIANNTFRVEAVSVDPATLAPDEKNIIGFTFDGTSATLAKYSVKNNSSAAVVSSASVTVPTTAGAVSYYEVEPFADEAWFHGGTMDSNAGRTASFRKHKDIPNPNALYKIRIVSVNGGTAPASATTLTCPYICCNDYAELTAEITAGRGQSAAGQAIGVIINATAPVSNTPASPTTYQITSAATTNGANVKSSAGNLYTLTAANLSASVRYVKIYSKSTAPTVGTDVPIMTIPLPATSFQCINFGSMGVRVASGIGVAITGAMAVADTTAIAAGDVQLGITYI